MQVCCVLCRKQVVHAYDPLNPNDYETAKTELERQRELEESEAHRQESAPPDSSHDVRDRSPSPAGIPPSVPPQEYTPSPAPALAPPGNGFDGVAGQAGRQFGAVQALFILLL